MMTMTTMTMTTSSSALRRIETAHTIAAIEE